MSKRNHLETAEHHMVTNIPKALPHETLEEVLERMFAPKSTYDSAVNIYVVDEDNVLQGVVSFKDAINKPHTKTMKQLMSKQLYYVRTFTDQEAIAQKAMKHHLKSVPVVDVKKRLLGTVPSRTIFDILHWEHTEDMLRMAGLNARGSEMRTAIKAGVLKMSLIRLPSLLVGLSGGLITTSVMQHFQHTLESQLLLALFIPIVLYLSSAVGMQTGTILVRTLATENVRIWRYMLRELIIGFIVATVIGVVMFAVSLFWHGVFEISMTISVALFASISMATILGIAIPWLLQRFNKDPAISGGPLINVIQDIVTLFIYFSTASIFLL